MMSRTSLFIGGAATRFGASHAFTPAPLATSCSIRFFASSSDQGLYDKISFIGAGKMAQALMSPVIKSGLQPAHKIQVFDVSTSTLSKIKKQFDGIQTANTLSELVEDANLIVCCVKPQNLTPNFFEQITGNHDAILLSVIAGKPIQTFLDGGFTKVARSMPNTPAMIGRGMTVWSCTENVALQERDKIKQILSSCGKSIFVDDEDFIDMSTSISGSGPAYIFMLMESMIDAGVHMGFSRETATTLVHHTILGSTLYAMETGEHPAILRNSVTSPAGTTASALYELENGRFRTVIKDAIWACYRRSLEMGGHDSNVGPGRNTAEVPVVHHYVDAPKGEMVDDDSDSNTDGDEAKAIQNAARNNAA